MKPLSVTLLSIVFLFLQYNISANSLLNSNSLKNTTFSISYNLSFHLDTSIIGKKSDMDIEETEEDLEESFNFEFNRIKNPITGKVADFMYLDAKEKTKKIQQFYTNNRTEGLKWTERGPNNVSGRTRVILVDENDSTRRTVFAGSVSGGLWKTTDITAEKPNWKSINDNLENLSISSLVQDPKNPKIMYMGTGEGYPTSNVVKGSGIFKSTDGGNTWMLLPSTKKSLNFEFVIRLVFNQITNALFAATSNGLYRTNDGGLTWLKIISNTKINDLEWSTAGYMLASSANSIFKLSNADTTTYTNLTSTSISGFIKNLKRIEFNICRDYPNIIYAIGALENETSKVMRSNNGGINWQILESPFYNDIPWFVLDICVAPLDSNIILVGGITLVKSIDGGKTFKNIGNSIHVDQHFIHFDSKNDNLIYVGNDGGVYRCSNILSNNEKFDNKSINYNTSQFFSCAIHPDTFSNYFLGGPNDNNSLKMNGLGISSGLTVKGGIGSFCHIDQKLPNYQIVSSQFADYSLSKNSGQTWDIGFNFNGNWISASDYDSNNGILYSQSSIGDIYEWKVRLGLQPRRMTIKGAKVQIESILCDPNKGGRVYIGSSGGNISVIENALQNDTNLTAVALTNLPGFGTVGCINVEDGNENHLIATMTNTGLANNIFESFDRGKTWIGVEGTGVVSAKRFPDIPVYWVIFAPGDASKALIATEFGVWHTEKLDGTNTEWIPPSPSNGIPLVRTVMLKYRKSDKLIVAATYGRGLWSTTTYSPLIVKFLSDNIAYTNKAISFQNISINGNTFKWEFGDGNTSTSINPSYKYKKPGVFKVTLTADGLKSYSKQIVVLPKLAAYPYQFDVAEINRALENSNIEFAIDNKSGTKLIAIENDITRKYDFKLNINDENRMESGNSSNSILYFPNFDFSENAEYIFSFKSKFNFNPQNSGFYFEYSINNGESWQHLGFKTIDWYNSYGNEKVFEKNQSIFSGEINEFSNYRIDLSFLSNNDQVAIRLIAKSELWEQREFLEVNSISLSKNMSINNIQNIDDEQFKIFPNPFVNKINIISLNHIKGEIEVKLYNLNGKLEFARSLSFNDFNTIELNNLISGEYILQLKKNDKILLNKKVICME